MRNSGGARAFSIDELDRVIMFKFRLRVGQPSGRRRVSPFTFWFTPKNTGESAFLGGLYHP